MKMNQKFSNHNDNFLSEFSSSLLGKYSNSEINPNYYDTIKINTTESKHLTEEEFMRGVQGVVFYDSKNNTISFNQTL